MIISIASLRQLCLSLPLLDIVVLQQCKIKIIRTCMWSILHSITPILIWYTALPLPSSTSLLRSLPLSLLSKLFESVEYSKYLCHLIGSHLMRRCKHWQLLLEKHQVNDAFLVILRKRAKRSRQLLKKGWSRRSRSKIYLSKCASYNFSIYTK